MFALATRLRPYGDLGTANLPGTDGINIHARTEGLLLSRATSDSNGGATSNNTGRVIFFSFVGIAVLIVIAVSLRKRAQMHRNNPSGIVPPGSSYWSRSTMNNDRPGVGQRSPDGDGAAARSWSERERSYPLEEQPLPPPYASHHRRSSREDSYLPFPHLPLGARTRQPRVSPDYPIDFLFMDLYTTRMRGFERSSSPVPSYEEPKLYSGTSITVTHSPETEEPEPDQADSKEFDILPLASPSSKEKETNECPICFEGFSLERPAVIGAPCGHILCKRCWRLIVDASKQATVASRRYSSRSIMGSGSGSGSEVGARCHACRMPYIRKRHDSQKMGKDGKSEGGDDRGEAR
ncbi:uncharacterized protein EI90DRAFT_3149602 [Cantharellus anzutake]|uniref:uncharacterized protein n=1 Tax=Cantharellus anzutake TaxID=1750568 RepID=UPI001903D800|nr:uncharacterized protein EI90DRAFT_3149602 [Cantharellus anzutake]KAF8344212.1 hypothetical protein EI90DRAFT_3149602 [Cantharellus anzutake]